MPGRLPFDDATLPIFTVGQVADMLGVQQAFLRRLDQHDLVSPARSEGRQRRYSRNDLDRVQEVVSLVGEGLTLGGVRRVLDLQQEIAGLRAELRDARAELSRRPRS